MLPECLTNVCQRKSFMENYKWENVPMVDRESGKRDRESGKRTPSKPPLKTSVYQQSRGKRLHRIKQSGETSQEGVLVNRKQKGSAKPSRNVLSGKPELRHHQQSFLPQTPLALSATGSLELRLLSAILKHTNNNALCV